MRIVVQRVTHACVSIGSEVKGKIGQGLMVLVGVEENDTDEDAIWLASKTVGLRIFNDDHGVMNLSVRDIAGEVLSVSQFTLTASTRKGNRPGYTRAAGHELAIRLYNLYSRLVAEGIGKPVDMGVFGADMQVELCNDGPVTIIIDSRLRE